MLQACDTHSTLHIVAVARASNWHVCFIYNLVMGQADGLPGVMR